MSAAVEWAGAGIYLRVISTSIDKPERDCEISKVFELGVAVAELSAAVRERRIRCFNEDEGGDLVSLNALGVEEFTSGSETALTCSGTVVSVGASSAERACMALARAKASSFLVAVRAFSLAF